MIPSRQSSVAFASRPPPSPRTDGWLRPTSFGSQFIGDCASALSKLPFRTFYVLYSQPASDDPALPDAVGSFSVATAPTFLIPTPSTGDLPVDVTDSASPTESQQLSLAILVSVLVPYLLLVLCLLSLYTTPRCCHSLAFPQESSVHNLEWSLGWEIYLDDHYQEETAPTMARVLALAAHRECRVSHVFVLLLDLNATEKILSPFSVSQNVAAFLNRQNARRFVLGMRINRYSFIWLPNVAQRLLLLMLGCDAGPNCMVKAPLCCNVLVLKPICLTLVW